MTSAADTPNRRASAGASSPMKIVILTIYYWPEPVPKPHELAEGLAEAGHDVTVITAFPHYPNGRLYPGYRMALYRREHRRGVRIVRVPVYPDHSASWILRALQGVSFPLSAVLLGSFWVRGADIIYVWGNPPTSGIAGWLLSRLHRAKFAYGVHDLWPDLARETGMVRNACALKVIRSLEMFAWRHADLILPISHGLKAKIFERIGRSEGVEVIPHWADERIYCRMPCDEALRAELGLTGRTVIVYAGNIGKVQGLGTLVRAAGMLRSELPSLHVLLVGDGVERESLRRMVADEGITNVTFVDRVPPEEVVRYFSFASALYVGLVGGELASLSIPSKLATSLACGRPILCSVPGEAAELINMGDLGIVCSDASVEGVADGLRRLAALDDDAQERMGRRARGAFAEGFAMGPLLNKHEALMTVLAQNSRTSSSNKHRA